MYSHGMVSNLRRNENPVSSNKSSSGSTNNSDKRLETQASYSINENIFWNRILGSSLPQLYRLKVSNGVGDGDYLFGARVEIAATPCPKNERFDLWVILGGSLDIEDSRAKVTTLTMPAEDSVVKAMCKQRDSTDAPTAIRTKKPTRKPTAKPSKPPTATPTSSPTPNPTKRPTDEPTKSPTSAPTDKPTKSPTSAPTDKPTKSPTTSPTPIPTSSPTREPTPSPTQSPTNDPTVSPIAKPTPTPTRAPSTIVTNRPTPATISTSSSPSVASLVTTAAPTTFFSPTPSPTVLGSTTVRPTPAPSTSPSRKEVTEIPTVSPSLSPVVEGTSFPTPSVTDDFTYVCERYVAWDNLDPTLRTSAIEDLGYTELSWNNPYAPNRNRIEQRSWDGLGKRRQGGATVIGGFDQETWDCQVNHYEDYDWDELVEEEVQECYVALGYDKQSWNKGTGVPTDEKMWAELSPAERAGAECVCFFEDLWMEVPLDEGFVATPC